MASAAMMTTDRARQVEQATARVVEQNAETIILGAVEPVEPVPEATPDRLGPARGALIGIAVGASMWCGILLYAIPRFLK